MKTNKFVVRTESDETLYECPECKLSFIGFTVICDSRWKQIPKYCIYCGAEMDTDVPFMKPGDEDDEDDEDKPDTSNQKKKYFPMQVSKLALYGK